MVKKKPRKPPQSISESLLVDYLKRAAVSELVVVEQERGVYRLEALLTWRTERSVLITARGGIRVWRSLDTLRRFFAAVEVGRTAIRLELLA